MPWSLGDNYVDVMKLSDQRRLDIIENDCMAPPAWFYQELSTFKDGGKPPHMYISRDIDRDAVIDDLARKKTVALSLTES